MNFYDNLNAKNVFHFFEEISKIPRGSFNEKGISNYLVNFGKERNLESYQDDIYNVIIKKNATEGLGDAPTIILQGHTDMVCEKNSGTEHDFLTDPIEIIQKDDMLYANGTTLGADNGIAVAMMLAILDSSDIAHPRIECLFTTQEEVGLNGAQALEPSSLDGKILINLDSEEYGNFLVSCAGGATAEVSLDCEWTLLDGDYDVFNLKISGLKGGHSGLNIIEERGNAIKIMGRLLSELDKVVNFEIQSIEAGSKDNAIPREAMATIAVAKGKEDALSEFVSAWESTLRNELRGKDNPISIVFEKTDTNKVTVFNQNTKRNVIYFLSTVSNGVNTMSYDIKDLVESSKNIGVISQDANYTKCLFSIRSSVESLLLSQINELEQVAGVLNSKVKGSGMYPGWEYSPVSPIRDLLVEVYKEIEKKEPAVSAIHAGLECGILKQKLGELDIVSLGPDIFNPHSPDEHVSVSSIDKAYALLVAVLEKANKLPK